MKVPKASRTFLEPEMVVDLLDAAGAREREMPEHQRFGRRAFLATLCLAGPRISELIDSPRGRVDLHTGQLVLGKKTKAGLDRTLELSAFLLDELRAELAAVPDRLRDSHDASLPIFPTWTVDALNPSNVRNRLLNGTRPAARRAGLPSSRPYDLRHSFVSLPTWEGRSVAEQAGHSIETCSRDYVHAFKDYDAARRVTAAEQIARARGLRCAERRPDAQLPTAKPGS